MKKIACCAVFAISACVASPPPLLVTEEPVDVPVATRTDRGTASPVASPVTEPRHAAEEPYAGPAPDACLDARFEGPIGNCIAQSLVVNDTCEDRRYVIHFNYCYTGRGTDISGFSGPDHVLGALEIDGQKAPIPGAQHRILAIRGSLSNGPGEFPGATFDLAVDVERSTGVVTKHLEGRTDQR